MQSAVSTYVYKRGEVFVCKRVGSVLLLVIKARGVMSAAQVQSAVLGYVCELAECEKVTLSFSAHFRYTTKCEGPRMCFELTVKEGLC